MDDGDSLNQIIYIKYIKENMKKPLLAMKDKEKTSRGNHTRGEKNGYNGGCKNISMKAPKT